MIGRKVGAALLVGVTSFIVSHLVALAGLAISAGFGQGDLWPFAFWTICFSVSLGFGTFGLIRLFPSKRHTPFLALPSGLLFGLMWTLLVRLILGPWFLAFSLPVLVSWTTGAAAGLLAGERFLRRAWMGAALLPSAVLALGVLLVLNSQPLRIWYTRDQSLTFLAVKWTVDRDAVLAIDSRLEEQLSRNEIEFLESSGVRGTLAIARRSRTGKGPEARIILIMHRQIQKTVRLPLPCKTRVLYLQKEDSWLKFPPDAPEIDRQLEIFPFLRFANDTQFFVELAPGGRTGGNLFRWDRDEVEERN